MITKVGIMLLMNAYHMETGEWESGLRTDREVPQSSVSDSQYISQCHKKTGCRARY